MNIIYEHRDGNLQYQGYAIDGNFVDYMKSRVAPRYRDDKGYDQLYDVNTLEQFQFDTEVLKDAVQYIPAKITEVLAECFLMDYCNVLIPYNRMRDSLNPKASPAGPDIIGMTDTMFIFGEIKSSSQQKHPPSVVDGKSGLIKQLNHIKNSKKIRFRMITWLGLKIAQNGSNTSYKIWSRIKGQYLKSNKLKFKIYGVLVRDTKPDKRDVTKVYQMVSNQISHLTFLDILALYLPAQISRLPEIMRD